MVAPRRAAWLLGAGRGALGVAILAAPEQVTGRWLGRENAAQPLVARMARMLGARDLALGIASLQTLDDPVLGPRVLAACALADSVDTVATILARRVLPRRGMLSAVAVGSATAVACLHCARRLARG
jgi:hypothetical protein